MAEQRVDDNFFHEFRDGALKSALNDYLEWFSTGIIPDDGVLAKARDYYCKKYDAHGLIILEQRLLFECAMRWKRLVKVIDLKESTEYYKYYTDEQRGV